MSNLINAEAGESIYHVIQRALTQANKARAEVIVTHNDTSVRVYPGSHEYDIADKFYLRRELDRAGRFKQ